ncbi:MAG: HAD-IIB family hydrolase [Gemmiger sp.]
MKLLLLDIDGTLRPQGHSTIPRENVDAVRAVQRLGVKVAIATGRGRANVPKELLRGLRPDYWLCAGGAQVLDGAGNELASVRMSNEEMYALVDFFEDYDFPLRFIYSDASYAYVNFAEFDRREKALNLHNHIVNGEDQDRHLVDKPFTAFGFLPPADAERFQQKYGYLGLRFLYSSVDGCDILSPGVDKAAGMQALLDAIGLTAADCVAMGDGDNDAEMLRAAGLGVSMASGNANAIAAADRTAESVAALCRELWPDAF